MVNEILKPIKLDLQKDVRPNVEATIVSLLRKQAEFGIAKEGPLIKGYIFGTINGSIGLRFKKAGSNNWAFTSFFGKNEIIQNQTNEEFKKIVKYSYGTFKAGSLVREHYVNYRLNIPDITIPKFDDEPFYMIACAESGMQAYTNQEFFIAKDKIFVSEANFGAFVKNAKAQSLWFNEMQRDDIEDKFQKLKEDGTRINLTAAEPHVAIWEAGKINLYNVETVVFHSAGLYPIPGLVANK